ncbi:DUF4238 domain-containing protein [Micromonospora sp. WMMD712]|uniref:DUF4238 domain-containing protein n=1 Tax=Micromonospora sp. WMMD712 TaxID=3016096 RepID=UPI00249C4940|nr:DUF4238 domain-containing protein [Micromonospora sp. WMMD712]WFE56599.1 DUF4238 domain-containing protein [Micromonospora sp. WMMD712]
MLGKIGQVQPQHIKTFAVMQCNHMNGGGVAKRVRRQHVVSQFYLKGFATDARQIRRTTLPGTHEATLATADATVNKDFYTIILPDGTKSDAFERAFAELETSAAAAFQAASTGTWPLTGQLRHAVAAWIALQHLRTEGIRYNQNAHNATMIRLLVGVSGKEALRQVIQKAERRVVTDDELDWEWRDLTKPGGPELIPSAHEHLQLLISLVDPMTAYLNDAQWSVIRFKRRALLTSDEPVSLLVRSDYPAWRGVGIATADAFLLPLNRHMAMLARPRASIPAPLRDMPDATVPGTTQLANTVNQETALGARRYLYQHPDDDLLNGLHLPEPRTDGPDPTVGDDFVHEQGFFHGVDEATLASLARATGPRDHARSFSINDLPWPIPGRRVPTSRPSLHPQVAP